MRPEALLERQILRRFGRDADVLLCKNEVGVGYARSAVRQFIAIVQAKIGRIPDDATRILQRSVVAYGLGVGSPDLALWVAGRSAMVELKSETGRLSDEQRQWHLAARARGVRVELVQSEAQMAELIEEMRERG